MESFYKKVYLQTWQIIKTNWYLLFFGVFVVALGLTGEFKSLVILENEDILLSSVNDWINIIKALIINGVDFTNIPLLSETIGVLFFFAILLVLGISSQGALINATSQNRPNGKKKNNQGLLAANLRTGVDNFWQLLGLNILNKLIGSVFVAGVIAPIIYAIYLVHNPPLANLFVAIVVFFSFIPLSIIISFVTRYGAAYIVLKKKNLITAFFDGWTLFRINWIISLENALVISLLTGLYTVIVISFLVFLIIPFIILSAIALQLSSFIAFIVLLAGGLLVIFTIVFAAGLYGAYYTVVWTEVFLKLIGKGKSLSKTERLVRKHLPALAK